MKIPTLFLGGILIVAAYLPAAAADFPPTAAVMTADQVKTYLSGKDVNATTSSGATRMQFKADGVVYMARGGNTSSGKWRTEDGKLCFAFRNNESCNEVRMVDGVMHLKRDNGEIQPYPAQ